MNPRDSKTLIKSEFDAEGMTVFPPGK